MALGYLKYLSRILAKPLTKGKMFNNIFLKCSVKIIRRIYNIGRVWWLELCINTVYLIKKSQLKKSIGLFPYVSVYSFASAQTSLDNFAKPSRHLFIANIFFLVCLFITNYLPFFFPFAIFCFMHSSPPGPSISKLRVYRGVPGLAGCTSKICLPLSTRMEYQ